MSWTSFEECNSEEPFSNVIVDMRRNCERGTIIDDQFSKEACSLIDSLCFPEVLSLIEKSKADLDPGLFEFLAVVIRKLYIFCLILNQLFSKAYIEIINLKHLLESSDKYDFTEFIADLEIIIQIPHFEKSSQFKLRLSWAIFSIQHYIQYGDVFFTDITKILYFEKQLKFSLQEGNIQSISGGSNQIEIVSFDSEPMQLSSSNLISCNTSSTNTSASCHNFLYKGRLKNKYIKLSSMKNVRFCSIKLENINKRIVTILLKQINKNGLNDKIIGSDLGSILSVQGVSYRSCSNHYLCHLFSFDEIVNLYEKVIVSNSKEIEKSMKKGLKYSQCDSKTVSWYILNMHKVFSHRLNSTHN